MKKSQRIRLDARQSALWATASFAAAVMLSTMAYNLRLHELMGWMLGTGFVAVLAILGAIYKAVQYMDLSNDADREEYWEDRRIQAKFSNCDRI
jgi:hypothetical protein